MRKRWFKHISENPGIRKRIEAYFTLSISIIKYKKKVKVIEKLYLYN